MAKEKDSAPQKIDVSKMKPSQKVAGLLILLGPGSSAEILKNIHDDEVLEQITLDIASMQKLPTEALEEIVNEFHTIFKASDMVSSGGMNYAKTLLEKAYGSEEADKILDRLVDAGNTVVVIEHNLDVIKCADHIIDLGPEGGDKGGEIVAVGTPEEVAKCEKSYTGQFLGKLL